MNKKKLSVVMAGAMLASSVAPVLAASTSELDSTQLGSLVTKVYDKLTSERFTAGTGDTEAGKSLYYVSIDDVKNTTIDNLTIAGSEAELKDAIQEAFKGLTADQTVKIYSKGYLKLSNGNIVSKTQPAVPVYTDAQFTASGFATLQTTIVNALNGGTNDLVDSNDAVVLDEGKSITIYFKQGVGLDLPEVTNPTSKLTGTFKKMVITPGQEEFDFTKYSTATDGSSAQEIATQNPAIGDVKSFPKKAAAGGNQDLTDTLLETITITGTVHNYKTTDLYDGLMLTTEGHDLLSLVKEVRNDKNNASDAVIKNLDKTVTYSKKTNISLSANTKAEYGFVLVVTDSFGGTTEYTVKGDKTQTEVLASWLNNELAKVDILAGDNRYETAVSIAKEQAQVAKLNAGETSNIVLVNGNSLVDGLSAASLAAKVNAGASTTAAAPILLTEADALPSATKAYLKELLAAKTVGNLNTKVYLVGGTSVLNRSLVNELEDLGFDVERIGGDNREETSLKVAEKVGMSTSDSKEVFVVGAEGEADAMSIAGVAATKETPIIVSKKGGLSEDALDALKGEKVTVIGGELSVSAEDYEALKEVTVDKNGALRRISGDNRQATNAAIIKEFYKDSTGINTKSVIVAKDGKGNNKELVDALTAANLAAQTNAPVVLAKNSLSAEQIDALNLRAKSSESLYQVGIGVDTSVVETIAKNLGLLNK